MSKSSAFFASIRLITSLARQLISEPVYYGEIEELIVNKLLFFKVFIFLTGCGIISPVFAYIDALTKQILQAQELGQPLPNVSKEAPVNMANAYLIQTAVVKNRLQKDKIAGFKAGFTTNDARSLLPIERPIFGVLLKSGDFSGKQVISLKKYNNLLVETELGFITQKPIKRTVQSIAELKSYIAQIVPVVELPDLRFANQVINSVDLVAGNAGSNAYLVYRGINWYGQNVNLLSVSLFHEGVIVNQGQGSDALGDQWEALRWLVNQVIAQGWTIEKNNLLITGALGKIVPAKPGTYRAQFNDGATIEITFTA